MRNKNFIDDCAKKQFAEMNCVKPNEDTIKIGEAISTLIKKTINNDEFERFVVCGSYSDNLSTNICKYGRVKNEVLVYNILTLEFLSDFIMFSENRDKKHFVYLLGKYMSKIEFKKNSELSGFYYWLYSGVSDNTETNNIDGLYNASFGMIFVLLHEFVHTRSDLIESAENLFELEASKNFFEHMDDEQIIEIACDFVAFSLINESVENKSLGNMDITDLVKYAFLSLLILEIYSVLKSLDLSDMETSSSNISKSLEHSLDFIEKRFATLIKLIKVAKNSNMFLKKCDITNIIDDIKKIMSSFFECFDCFLSDLKEYIDRYNSLDDNERKRFSAPSENEVWFSLI